MKNELFVTAGEVAQELGVSKPFAYKLVRQMNEELEEKGFITIAGRVSRKYYEEKFYVDNWFQRSAGKHKMPEYCELIEKVRNQKYPVKIKFGLEICYFKEDETFIGEMTKDQGFDFLLGSIHFVDRFAFDHKPEHWIGIDVDTIYRRYFEDSISLAKSKLFDGIGHPDAIKLFGHRPSFSLLDCYESLAKELSNSNMYADQNSGVARRCSKTSCLGMDKDLLHILKKKNIKIITSSDAHCPEDVGDKIRELEICVANA